MLVRVTSLAPEKQWIHMIVSAGKQINITDKIGETLGPSQ